jgi:hypothetical protein
LAGCQREQVKPHKRIMMAVTEAVEETKPQGQKTLEGWTVAKVPQWSRDGLMEHIIELVVVDDQVRSVKFFYVTSSMCSTRVFRVTGTRRLFPWWTVQPSDVCSCSNALLPRIVTCPTARVSPTLSLQKRTKSRIF